MIPLLILAAVFMPQYAVLNVAITAIILIERHCNSARRRSPQPA
jgi:hypothetical protein